MAARTLNLVGLMVLGALLQAGSALGDAAPAPVTGDPGEPIWHFKQVHRYAIDPARVAVYDPTGAWRTRGAGAGRADVTDHALSGWSFVALPQRDRTAARVREVLRAPAPLLGIDERAAAGLFVSPVLIDDLGGPMLVRPELLVRFEAGVPGAFAGRRLGMFAGARVVAENAHGLDKCFRLRTSEGSNGLDVLALAGQLASDPLVRFCEPDMVFTGRGDAIPNDPGFSQCWGLRNTGQFGGLVDFDMDVSEAWDITTGSASIKVVVIDVGVQQDHPDLNQVPGTDTSFAPGVNGGPNNACDNHGTAVAGCVTGIINNALGTCGVAPGCKVASARTFVSNVPCDGGWSSGVGETLNTLNWAASIGARVTNNSNYYGFQSSAISDLYTSTRAGGMVHFASAGNDASGTITYPSSIPSVNSVAALASNGTRASFSNFGPGLDFSAPGQTIYSTDRTGSAGYYAGDYGAVDGTSFASPYASGVAALILSQTPSLTASQVEGLMQSTGTDLGSAGYDTGFGWGMPNAYTALTGTPPPPPPPPGPFNLLSPASNATGVALSTTLDWSDASGASSYIVTLDDTSDFSSPIFSVSVAGASQVGMSPGTLQQATTYYWKVVARSPELQTTPSTPASASFTTVVPPPACRSDLSHDGAVNTVDLSLLLGDFGRTVAPGSGADLNSDGRVNTADLIILLSEFGRSDCPV